MKPKISSYLLLKKQQAWLRSVRLLNSCFYKNDLNLIVSAGTLLSIFRDNQLFPHLDDEDVDFCIVINMGVVQRLKLVVSELRNMKETISVTQDAFGMHVRMKTLLTKKQSLLLTLLYILNRVKSAFPRNRADVRNFFKRTYYFWWHTREVIVNITFFRGSEDFYWSAGYKTFLREAYGSPPVDYIARTVPRVHYDYLKKIDFFNLSLWAPNNIELYLAHLYGQSWSEPSVNWNYFQMSGEVDLNFSLSSTFHFVQT